MDKLSLSAMLGMVEMTLAEAFFDQTFYVTAETADIRNYRERNYCFLKLIEKDESGIVATADAVLWRQAYPQIAEFERKTGTRFENSLEVLLEVSVEYSPKWGLRINVHKIDASFTLGKLELQRRDNLKRLVTEHPQLVWERDGVYYSHNKCLAISSPIRRIALITAPASDGQRDFQHELQHNSYGYQFKVDEYLTQVQGNGAEKLLIAQFKSIQSSGILYDMVVLVRGGGSQTDFGPFDTYDLGLCVAAFQIPIITGIGHERNVSIADLLSYCAVKTPTKAAAFVIEQTVFWEQNLLEKAKQITDLVDDQLEVKHNELNRKVNSILRKSELLVEREQNRLNKYIQAIHHLNPERVLERGYAMLSVNGMRIKKASEVNEGDTVEIALNNWQMEAEVKTISNSKL